MLNEIIEVKILPAVEWEYFVDGDGDPCRRTWFTLRNHRVELVNDIGSDWYVTRVDRSVELVHLSKLKQHISKKIGVRL